MLIVFIIVLMVKYGENTPEIIELSITDGHLLMVTNLK